MKKQRKSKSTLVPNPLVNQLTIGQTFSTFPALCKFLGEERTPASCHSRDAQVKQFHRMFNWKPTGKGRQLMITEIYPEPLPDPDKRLRENVSLDLTNHRVYAKADYLKEIEKIIIRYLAPRNKNHLLMTYRQLWRALGMIGPDYTSTASTDLHHIPYMASVTSCEINWFYQRAGAKMTAIVQSALNSMKKRGLLSSYEMVTVVQEKEMQYETYTKQERVWLDLLEEQVLEEMGYNSKFHVVYAQKSSEFHHRVCELLDQKYGWKDYHQRLRIQISDDLDITKYPPLEDWEYAQSCEELNRKVLAAIDADAEVVYKRTKRRASQQREQLAREKLESPGVLCSSKWTRVFDYSDNYVEIQHRLSRLLIPLNRISTTDWLMEMAPKTSASNESTNCSIDGEEYLVDSDNEQLFDEELMRRTQNVMSMIPESEIRSVN